MQNLLFLIGYMGAGKTTIGKRLAQHLGLPFIDLDWMIEEKYGMKVSCIFKNEGEASFREKERAVLHDIGMKEDAVIALGGGTPCFSDNMDYISQHGTSVYLKAHTETLINHIRMGTNGKPQSRPLIDGKSDEELTTFISQNLIQREPFYLRANYVVEIETLRTQQQIDHVCNRIRALLML